MISLATLVVLAQATLLPLDEAARRPDFFTFRAHLQSAIARRDARAVLAVVHENVRISFGGGDGKAAFQRAWELSRPERSRLWEELAAVLALGGTFEGADRFVAPYVFSRWPERFDAFEHVAIVGSSVRVRAAPRENGATMGSLSFAIAPVARTMSPEARRAGWIPIRMPDGRTGYVAAALARSPVGYRAIFERLGGRWQLTALVAGD